MNGKLKGSILIFLGASCYGMLGIYVKKAYLEGYNTAEVTLSQFGIGFITLFIVNVFRNIKRPQVAETKLPFTSKLKLMVAGTSLGLTSIFYYLAVIHIPVSFAIVLLMQTVWMGIILEMLITKKIPDLNKIVAAIMVIIGSVIATNLLGQSVDLNWKGVLWGMMAALCYTATMYSTKNIKPQYSPYQRSLYMILGGLVIICIVYHSSLNSDFNYHIFYSWGLLISLFGTVLPPLLFTAGMPLTGIGLGAILSSVEIPVAVLAASLLLKENVSPLQWFGVILILIAVGVMNLKNKSGPDHLSKLECN
ncbi:DMT family transporter [Pedobacter hiemivivus]|uniref:DMT family transporter n=1 Tax=Pedobacter hiemivivus TaxID=2530454 RepID=A0A4U1GL17_9SPHI|nr:DMT family transporter [Pedobacter hiemivivus]TKC63680.1 DMT family transporter [Pedobacter hiemivivus]